MSNERDEHEWLQSIRREMDQSQQRCLERENRLREFIRDVDARLALTIREMRDASRKEIDELQQQTMENSLSLAKLAGIGMAGGAVGFILIQMVQLIAAGLRAQLTGGG